MRVRAAQAPALAAAVAFSDMVFATALPPLVPRLTHDGGMTKAQIGIVVGAHSAGAFLGAVPALLLIGRGGPRPFLVVGLAASALACVWFAFAASTAAFALARGAHGLASVLAWIGAATWLVDRGPAAKRGSLVGGTVGAMWLGGAVGPALGGIGAAGGLVVPFLALAGLKAGLCAWSIRIVPRGQARQRRERLSPRAWRDGRVRSGTCFYMLPAVCLGALAALAPTELAALGWSAFGIATIYVCAALLQAASSAAIGRWSDRAARGAPLLVAVFASIVVSLLLAAPWLERPVTTAVLVVVGLTVFSLSMTPGLTLLSDGFDALRLGVGAGFALSVLVWTPASVLGAIGGSAAAAALSNSTTFLALGALSLLALPAAWALRQRGPIPAVRPRGGGS